MVHSVTKLTAKAAQGFELRTNFLVDLSPTRCPVNVPFGPPATPVPICPAKNEMVYFSSTMHDVKVGPGVYRKSQTAQTNGKKFARSGAVF